MTSKHPLEHSRSINELRTGPLDPAQSPAPKLSLPGDLNLNARSMTSPPPVNKDLSKLGSPVIKQKQKRLSISEGLGMKNKPFADDIDFLFNVRVPEAEVKNVTEPLFWKAKFDGHPQTSSVSVSAKWNECFSFPHGQNSLRLSLWKKKESSNVKLATYDAPLEPVRAGGEIDGWFDMQGLDHKPVEGMRIHLVIKSNDKDEVPTSPASVEEDLESSASKRRPSVSPHLNASPVNLTSSDPQRRGSHSLASGSPLGTGMNLRRDVSHIKEMLKDRPASVLERESQWRKFFELPESDLLVGDWSAAFMKGVARHGRLFVFTDHLCFHSNLFGVKTAFTIPFMDVIGIEKTVENLTPGIKVKCNDRSFNFGGIYARVKCYEMMSNIWKGSYVLVDDTEELGVEVGEEDEEKMMEEKFPEELLSSKGYEKDGFLGGVDELTELLQDELPVTPTRFFQLFISNESNFEKDYHESRGDTEVKVEPWQPHETFGTTRNVFYVLKLSGPIGPPTTRTEEVHRYHLQKDRLIIDTSMNMLDAPYGDYFRVESQWMISLKDEHKSHIKISAKAVFMKSTMMKGTISSRTLAGMTESFKFWLGKARDVVSKKSASGSPKGKGSPGGEKKGEAEAAKSDAASPGSSGGAAVKRSGGSSGFGIGGLLGAVFNKESMSNMVMTLNLVIQVLLVYVLIKIINKL